MLLHKQLTIRAPAQTIFAYWADFHHFQQFIPLIEKIDLLDNRHSRWVIRAPLGNKVVFESRITICEPDKRLVWESHHVDGHAKGDLKLSERDNDTLVELDYEYSLHRGWMKNIAIIASRFGFPSLAFDHGLAIIKRKIETNTR